MLTFLRAGLGNAIRTKVGIALIGAVLVGGGGTAMAMATTHGQLPFGAALTQSSATHSDSDGGSKTPSANKTADNDNDDQGCTGNTGNTTGTPSAHADTDADADDGSAHSGTPSANATPGTHSDSDDASDHESGTPSATRTASQGDDANEHEGSQDDQDDCGAKSTTTRTPMPEPTERPEGTRVPQPTGTPGTGGD
jgi:hypothetical protein